MQLSRRAIDNMGLDPLMTRRASPLSLSYLLSSCYFWGTPCLVRAQKAKQAPTDFYQLTKRNADKHFLNHLSRSKCRSPLLMPIPPSFPFEQPSLAALCGKEKRFLRT